MSKRIIVQEGLGMPSITAENPLSGVVKINKIYDGDFSAVGIYLFAIGNDYTVGSDTCVAYLTTSNLVGSGEHSSTLYLGAGPSSGAGVVSSNRLTMSSSNQLVVTSALSNIDLFTSTTRAIKISHGMTQRIEFNNTSPYAYKSAGGVWGTLSDSRLKQSITEINGALDKILTLHPVHYQFINQGENANPSGTRTGFIAQEFERVLPGHTFEIEPMLEADKQLLGEGVKAKGIEADLVPYLVKAIQELKAELDTVKAELATLKG